MRKWAAAGAVCALVSLLAAPGGAFEAQCSASEARAIVRDFVDAYNRGDVDYLDQVWAQEPDFFWFVDAGDLTRRGDLSEDRTTLPQYFRHRALLGDQLHLRRLSIGWERGWHAAWGFSFVLHRTSDQADASGMFRGKGAVTCGDDGQLLHAWRMGPAA